MRQQAMDEQAIGMLESFPVRTYGKGEFILHQDRPATHVFYLAEGTAVRNNYTVRGDELTYGERTADRSASCLLGALSFYTVRHINETNFVAKAPCVCHVLSEQEFMAFLQANPLVLNDLVYLAMLNYSELNASFRGKMKGLASSRVATYLLDHSAVAEDGYVFKGHFNVSEVSRELGLHRVTVENIVCALVDDGCIAYQGSMLKIESVGGLREFEDGVRKLNYQRSRRRS